MTFIASMTDSLVLAPINFTSSAHILSLAFPLSLIWRPAAISSSFRGTCGPLVAAAKPSSIAMFSSEKHFRALLFKIEV